MLNRTEIGPAAGEPEVPIDLFFAREAENMQKSFIALIAVAFFASQPVLGASLLDDAAIYTSGNTILSGNGSYGAIAAGGFSKSGNASYTLAGLDSAGLSAAMDDAAALSTYYLGLAPTSFHIDHGVLSGVSGMNVIDLTGEELGSLSSFDAAGATMLILNISGSFGQKGNFRALGGIGADSVLFNFYDGGNISLSGNASLGGTILAPDSSVTMSGNTVISGSIYASSFSGSGNARVDGVTFADLVTAADSGHFDDPVKSSGPDASVPEPGNLALMLLGIALVGIGRQRRPTRGRRTCRAPGTTPRSSASKAV